MLKMAKLLGVVIAKKDGTRVKTGGGYSSLTSKIYATEGKARAALKQSSKSRDFEVNSENYIFIPVYFPE
jgi:hypothetical protein